VAEKSLSRQPDHDVGVLAERPQHRDILDAVEGLTENENALAFELVQTIHDCLPACGAERLPHKTHKNKGIIFQIPFAFVI